MANEAVIVELLGNQGEVVDFTVADGTGVEKGTVMQMTDPRTASASSADGEVFAGIAASEKVASDGSTNLGLYTKGIFDLKDSGSGITVGDRVTIAGANTIKTAAAGEAETGQILGVALETAAASEVIEVAVGVY